ncbi:lipid IV(A) 3-deoxy-D-manno-octulosonic acid transferase [Halomonas sp. YLGW01]|uniref:lipid IV(A) 3-deoxy-D-manno-octulosonic acid transferase n=1 Tax=Halomonas sp. YLGW01 TaxID=2773308 RepID=UPI001786A4EF|nr:lipid IV(A) 3-deoxy-D-manno-octulosonic acid transferase [Halomonas sp. YLGW01]
MPARWPRLAYSTALYGLAPLIWQRVWREQALAHPRRERLGLIPHSSAGTSADGLAERPVTWLHCASVGEVLAARPLIEALVAARPGHQLVVTTMTATGADRVQALADKLNTEGAGAIVSHHFVPLDFPGAARRFVDRLAPVQAIFFETELWPNLLAACRRRGVPVAVVNGRLSPRAFARYLKIRPLMAAALANVDWLAAKSDEDAERFQALGMAEANTAMVGSLKFDMCASDEDLERSERLRTWLGERPTWVAGSTHPGEDEPLLAAHRRLLETHPEALLILVPRHPQRFDEVAALCETQGETQGMRVARRSRDERPGPETEVYLADTMGELSTLYGAADIAFVGGSLVPIGGHNLLEPAVLGVPVVTGPSLENFSDVAATLREAGALTEVPDGEALAATLAAFLDDPAARDRLGEAGRRVVAANRGALSRTLDGLGRMLEAKGVRAK